MWESGKGVCGRVVRVWGRVLWVWGRVVMVCDG